MKYTAFELLDIDISFPWLYSRIVAYRYLFLNGNSKPHAIQMAKNVICPEFICQINLKRWQFQHDYNKFLTTTSCYWSLSLSDKWKKKLLIQLLYFYTTEGIYTIVK